MSPMREMGKPEYPLCAWKEEMAIERCSEDDCEEPATHVVHLGLTSLGSSTTVDQYCEACADSVIRRLVTESGLEEGAM